MQSQPPPGPPPPYQSYGPQQAQHPHHHPYPYAYPQYPAPSSGASTVKIVLLVVGLIGFFFIACLGIGVKRGYDNAKRLNENRHDTFKSAPGESATYDTKDKLITAKYPPDFAAKSLDSGVLVVQKGEQILTFFGTDSPASDDVEEFARASYVASTPGLSGYREESRRTTTCGGHDGREYRGQWIPEGEAPRIRVVCYFIHNEHGFAVSYSAPAGVFPAGEATFRQIREGSTYR